MQNPSPNPSLNRMHLVAVGILLLGTLLAIFVSAKWNDVLIEISDIAPSETETSVTIHYKNHLSKKVMINFELNQVESDLRSRHMAKPIILPIRITKVLLAPSEDKYVTLHLPAHTEGVPNFSVSNVSLDTSVDP